MNLKTLLILIIISVTVISKAQQDTSKAFKYIGNEKWETTTPVIRNITGDLSDALHNDTIINDLTAALDSVMKANDSLKKAIRIKEEVIQQQSIRLKEKEGLIVELTQPKLIEKGNKPLIEYDGIYFNLGTYYKFSDHIPVSQDQVLKELRYFGSLDIGWKVLEKFRAQLEILIPLEVRAKASIRL